MKKAQARLGSTKALKFCDYTQNNLDAVQDWIEENDRAFDWTNFFVEVLDIHETPKENQYDIILSSLCLEAACLTIEIFDQTIERLIRLLKPGGLPLLLTIRNESFYYVGKEKSSCLPLNESTIKNSLNQTNKLVDRSIESSDGKMIIQAYKKN